MAPRSIELGPLELQILGLLSANASKSVSDIKIELKNAGNDLAYTTVMTVLSRLFQKGHVRRTKEGRQFVYLIAPDKEKARRSIFERMRTSLFQSDRLNPILALLDSKNELSATELRELKKVVDEKLKTAKDRAKGIAKETI